MIASNCDEKRWHDDKYERFDKTWVHNQWPNLAERIEVLAIVPMGSSLKIIGRGLKTGLTAVIGMFRGRIDSGAIPVPQLEGILN